MLDKQKQATKIQMQMAVSEGMPNLAFFGSFSKNNQQNDFSRLFNDKKSWLGTSIIGFSINVPIFSGLQELEPAPRRFLFFIVFNVVSWQCLIGPVLVLFARKIDMPPSWVTHRLNSNSFW